MSVKQVGVIILVFIAITACTGSGSDFALNPKSAQKYKWPSFAPVAIELGPDTRAINRDDKQLGGDGVRVRIAPKDNYGHTVKWPGKIDIIIKTPLLVGEAELCRWTYSPEDAGKHWVESALSGYYFKFLEWPEGKRPAYAKGVLKVVFTTRGGNRFEAHKSIDISLR